MLKNMAFRPRTWTFRRSFKLPWSCCFFSLLIFELPDEGQGSGSKRRHFKVDTGEFFRYECQLRTKIYINLNLHKTMANHYSLAFRNTFCSSSKHNKQPQNLMFINRIQPQKFYAKELATSFISRAQLMWS